MFVSGENGLYVGYQVFVQFCEGRGSSNFTPYHWRRTRFAPASPPKRADCTPPHPCMQSFGTEYASEQGLNYFLQPDINASCPAFGFQVRIVLHANVE